MNLPNEQRGESKSLNGAGWDFFERQDHTIDDIILTILFQIENPQRREYSHYGCVADCSNHAGGWLINGRCFVPVSSPTYGWFDANIYCLQNGGVLAQFDGIQSSILTNSTLIKNLDPSMAYWIGLIRSPWTWQYSGG